MTSRKVGWLWWQEGGLVVVAVLAAILIVIPLLFFGIELVVLGVLLAAGGIGRILFRQPWVIVARSNDPLTPGRRLEWRVIGWSKSRGLIEKVISDLAAGRQPPQSTLPS